jgi:hypothetical protein
MCFPGHFRIVENPDMKIWKRFQTKYDAEFVKSVSTCTDRGREQNVKKHSFPAHITIRNLEDL